MATRTRKPVVGGTRTPARPARFPEFEVSGSPRELGRQFGEACREQVNTFVGMVVDRFNKGRAKALDLDTALGVARGCVPYVERYAPDLAEEVRGIGEGARVAAA
jgi:isopenicillin-N N-acyltransferase-like protein